MVDRGQSEVIGGVLLFGLVITVTAGIVVLGSGAIADARGTATAGAARHSMTQLDSQASLVAHGSSDFQRTRITGAEGAQRRVDPDAGWVNITIRNETTGEIKAQLANVTLGAVVYEHGDTEIAYQGGGVWRTFENGSGMVSPPEFHYRGTTLTLPLVTVADGDQTLTEQVRLSKVGEDRDVYPNASADYQNPLEKGEVVVAVKSEYYDAWGRFFTERTTGEASVDHANGTATILLRTPAPTGNNVTTAIHSTAAGDEISMAGSGANPAYVDSYNSSNGSYPVTQTGNGTVLTSGDVETSGNARIEGHIRSGGSVTLSGTSEVTKIVEWTTGFSASGAAFYGGEEQIDGVAEATNLATFVRNRIDTMSGSNDNGATTAVDGKRLNFSGNNTVTLDHDEGSRYYLDKIDMAGSEELVIETRGSQVEVAIGNNVDLDGAKISVEGSGVARVYVSDDIDLDDGTNVSVPGDRSERLWVYGTSDTDIVLEGSGGSPVSFVGVFYATGGSSTSFDIKHAAVYGGVVAGEMDIQNGGKVHYDAALRDKRVMPTNGEVPRVTYLHVSIAEIRVESD